MKDTFFIGGLCTLIVVVGAALYFYDPNESEGMKPGEVGYAILAEGSTAAGIDQERNYRIESEEDFQSLWEAIHGDARPNMPRVDFEKNEVLAVFSGTRPTGGHEVDVNSIKEEGLTRTVYITHTAPGDTCMTTSAITSPYQLIEVERMRDETRLTHVDIAMVRECE